jgi:hypothetical protein
MIIWLAKLIIAWPLTLALAATLIGFCIGAALQVSAIIAAIIIVYLIVRTIFDFPAPELRWIKSIVRWVAGNMSWIKIADSAGGPGTGQQAPTIFACHPHGYLAIAPLIHVLRGDIPASLVTTPLAANFPGVGFLLRQLGIISSDKETIRDTLKAGKSVAILVGGSREAEVTEAGKMKLCADRRGIFEVARDLGVKIVPVLSYGENETFSVWKPRGIWQDWLKRIFHFNVILPTKWNFTTPIETHIGDAFDATGTVDEIRERYKAAFEELVGRAPTQAQAQAQAQNLKIEWISRT